MPLVLPLLRLLLLFVNVYETFKTLRPPRGGPRTGQPSVRAVSQRKRDMKGCMTVWLLWCCCTMFERNCDPVFGLVVPFYGEFKSLVYVFQLVTRARGAEPIYLHAIRPVIKPYAATLDWSLDTAALIGDFVMLLLWLPIQMVLDWWYPHREVPPQEVAAEPATTNGTAERAPARRIPSNSKSTIPTRVPSGNGSVTTQARPVMATVGTRTRRAGTNSNFNASTVRNSGAPGPSTLPSNRSAPSKAPSLTSKASNGNAKKYEVWHPPQQQLREPKDARNRPSAGRRNASDPVTTAQRVTSNPPTPPEPLPEVGRLSGSNSADNDDWRNYPPFPSAYPTTPYKAPEAATSTASADGAAITSVSERIVTDGNGVVVAEVEEWRLYPPFPSAYPPTPQKTDPAVNGSVPPSLDSVTETAPNAPPTRVQDVRPPAGKGQTRATSSQSLPTRKGRGGASSSRSSTLTQRSGRMDVDSDTNSTEQDFGRPRESYEDEGSDSRGEGSDGRRKKRRTGLRDEDAYGEEENAEDDDLDDDRDGSDDDMDLGLTDGDETMVASVDSLLDDDSPKTSTTTSEFGVKKDKAAISRTTAQLRVPSNVTARGRGRGASTLGVGVARRASQSSLTSRTSRSVSQSTVHSSISASNSLYTPVSRQPSTNSLATASSSSSNGSSSLSEGPGMGSFIGFKRPRSQMVQENRNRLKSKFGGGGAASGSAETLYEGVEDDEALEAGVNTNAPQVKKRKVGVGARQVRGNMPPPTHIPEGRGKKPF